MGTSDGAKRRSLQWPEGLFDGADAVRLLKESFAPGQTLEAAEVSKIVYVVTLPFVVALYAFFGWRLGVLPGDGAVLWLMLAAAGALLAIRAMRWGRAARSCVAERDGLRFDGVLIPCADIVTVRVIRDAPGFLLEVEARDGRRWSLVLVSTRRLSRRFGVPWSGPPR